MKSPTTTSIQTLSDRRSCFSKILSSTSSTLLFHPSFSSVSLRHPLSNFIYEVTSLNRSNTSINSSAPTDFQLLSIFNNILKNQIAEIQKIFNALARVSLENDPSDTLSICSLFNDGKIWQ